MKSAYARAVELVDRLGICLVFPLENRAEPPSLWNGLHPRSKMRWDWDENADPRVVSLWHLRERLARSGDVAYAKWFRGRATFFSLPVFHALLGTFAKKPLDVFRGLPRESMDILDLLRESSPRSTKQIRAEMDLKGRAFESIFTHAMKALWSRLLIVGVGEVADGAFPSLAVAATETMFEDVWLAREDVPVASTKRLEDVLAKHPTFARELKKTTDAVQRQPALPLDDEFG